MSTLLVLLAHGSHDPRWQAPFVSLLEELQGQIPKPPAGTESTHAGSASVTLAYMEMASPTLEAVVVPWLETYPTGHVKVFPLFMAAGGHLRSDVPRLLEAVQGRFPHSQWTLLPPMGEHPVVRHAMGVVALEALGGQAP